LTLQPSGAGSVRRQLPLSSSEDIAGSAPAVVTRGVPDLRLDLQYHCGSLTYKGRVFRSVCNPNVVTGPALREQIELKALLTQLPEGLFGRGLAHGGSRSDWSTRPDS